MSICRHLEFGLLVSSTVGEQVSAVLSYRVEVMLLEQPLGDQPVQLGERACASRWQLERLRAGWGLHRQGLLQGMSFAIRRS